MKMRIGGLVGFFSLLWLTGATVAAPNVGVPGEGVAGEWLGALSMGPMKLRIALHLESDEAGELSGSIDSLDQGALGIPIDRATFEGGRLEFSIFQINGTFDGRLSEDGSEIAGTWSQYGNNVPLAFLRQAAPVTLSRPQDPKPPYPYEAREVVFRNKWSGIELSGTYVVPEGRGPFPAVAFVSGSGPQDRDEALMGHRPFLVIADHLARRGIASLRYDDRGVGGSGGNHMESSVDDFATDALAAVEYLTRQREVDTDGVGIIGHSEGGVTGPMVANRSHCVSFLVLLAAPGVPLDRLLMRQSQDMGRQLGVDSALVERLAERQRRELDLVKDPELGRSALTQALMESWLELKPSLTEAERQQLQLTDQRVRQNIDLVATNWFRSLMRVDPATYLEQVTIPVLALYGERDVQVAAEANAAAVRAALERAGNEDSRVEVLSGLNHLFQNSRTGSIAEYGQIEETFDPAALALIADWVRERF